ncbi:MAG: sulfotransferase [Acidobacteria bacterium]|nr:sulfotransferase [Acidobacteriota bacterium]
MSVRSLLSNLVPHSSVKEWERFHQIIANNPRALLLALNRFQKPILVSGCQRSGTTALANLLFRSPDIDDYRIRGNGELEGAEILSGIRPYEQHRRCVFQTTYLDGRFEEYLSMPKDARLVWMLRNPESVIYSLVHNWARKPLDRLFESCGLDQLTPAESTRHRRLGKWSLSPLTKACAAYLGKTSHLFWIRDHLPRDQWVAVDYDHLVTQQASTLKAIFEFCNVSLPKDVATQLHARSTAKHKGWRSNQRAYIRERCNDFYQLASRETLHMVPNK